MNTWQSAALEFGSGHPVATGHFPGNPIIPGALLLDKAVATIAGDRLVTIQTVKFLQIIRPGAHVVLRWQSLGRVVKFECHHAESLSMTGTLEITS